MGGLFFPGGGGASPLLAFPPLISGYAPPVLTSGVTIHTFGAWVQFSADVGVGKRLYFLTSQSDRFNHHYQDVEIEVGEGAVASEVVVQRVSGSNITDTVPIENHLAIWPFVPGFVLTDNARISCRVRDSQGAARSWFVRLGIG